MRKVQTLLFLLFCAQSLLAQTLHKRPTPSPVVSALLRMNEERNALAAKPTAGVLMQRVVAQSTRDNGTSSLTDSVKLKYSGQRSSTYDYNMMMFPYNYPYGTSPMFDYAGVFTTPQVKYDTYTHWTINPFTMPAFGLYEGYYASYDTNSNLTNFKKLYVDSTLNDNMSYVNLFNAAKNISKGFTFNLNAGVADSAFIQHFQYDASNRLVKDSMYELHLGVWRIVARTLYTYDAAGNVTLIDHYSNQTDTSFLLPLTQQLKYTNTYDASNRLTTVLTTMSNGTVMGDYVKDTFTYSGTLTFHNSWKQIQMDPIHGTWWPQYYMQKTLLAGKPDTVYHRGWDSIANAWVPISKDIVSYNSYSNPDTILNYEYNWTSYSTTPDYTTVYYYDTFTYNPPSTSLSSASAQPEIHIYPNPASTNITLELPTALVDQRINVYFVNVSGQIITKQSVLAASSMTLNTSHLTNGSYWMFIENDNGQLLHRHHLIKY